MEQINNEKIMLYPIGLDLLRLNNVLKHGILTEHDTLEKNILFIKNLNDKNKNQIKLYPYDNITQETILDQETLFIFESICIVLKNVENNIINHSIKKENLKAIYVPEPYSQYQLNEINYLDFRNLSFEEIKDNCEKLLAFAEEYGYKKDKEKYQNSYDILKYSFLFSNNELKDEFEEARNYLNEDIGYDIEETFKTILKKEMVTLLDTVNYLNSITLNLPVKTIEPTNTIRKRIK
jgi:hypothetical protein